MISFPNAKINIGLDIERKRDDGYHEISTLFYPVDWCDVLEIVPSKGVVTTLTITGDSLEGKIEDNLVMRAYRKLSSVVDIPSVDIFLHKIIPSGAGLGGGSSDAAYTLLTLNEMFSLGLDDNILAGLASELGADCPFFIYNRSMMASGIGTTLKDFDLSLRGSGVIIVKPDVSISTKEAYANCVPRKSAIPLSDKFKKDRREWRGEVKNGFEEGLSQFYPEIDLIKGWMKDSGAFYESLSGSGSAVYGLFDMENFDSDNLSVKVKKTFPQCKIYIGILK